MMVKLKFAQKLQISRWFGCCCVILQGTFSQRHCH